MNTYLFVWNPKKWNWTSLEQQIEECEKNGKTTQRWSCRSYKTARIGDRAILAKVGTPPRGLFASGYIDSEAFLTQHWRDAGKDAYRVMIEFDVLLNPLKGQMLSIDILNTSRLSKQEWTPQSSGISIRPELVDELEAVWFDFLTTQEIDVRPFGKGQNESQQTFTEGAPTQVIQTRYERNPYARKICLQHFGYKCSVCAFDFEAYYGPVGKDFIHVHHLAEIASVKKSYSVDPIEDLRPVCPNCHAILHRQNPAFRIEELKALIDKQRKF
jgi:5-methylcytosine-specific restriction protein A